MLCDEYKKLALLHQSALYRIHRYEYPEDEPTLMVSSSMELPKRLETARAEEADTRLQMKAHIETCAVCLQN